VNLALMIEGQEDVTWDDWVALADACERSGIGALFRSDHYVSVFGAHENGSLDAWGTIHALAARTTTLRLGTMVSPTSFRHPSVIAKLAVTADHVSGGRVSLGLGTGWSEVEHTGYGFPFLSMKERMDVLEEQLEIIHDGHFSPGPFSFKGTYYELEGLQARPQPVQQPHLPLIMGGAAGPRAARLAARYADEYNTVMPTLDEIAERKASIDAACAKAGREPIPFTVMATCVIGADQAQYEARAAAVEAMTGSAPDPETCVVGTVEQARARLQEWEAAGVSGVYLQHLLHRDIEMVEQIGSAFGG
jgi:alkanesulfonate monooxygenase SsuD/methylene tetrahydromethanopterin reductase-like flavin-dependent oxidoreductase (luciferase family)